jgi:uncharacterized protein YbaA (DUF1428 family)
MSAALTWPIPANDDNHPGEDDAYVIVEHDSEEDGIVADVSRCLADGDGLEFRFNAASETYSVSYRGHDWPVPLAMSFHDRYITISSLAEILKDTYTFFFDTAFHGEGYHRLFIAANSTVAARGPLPRHLVPLQVGFDYFEGDPAKGDVMRVPYTGHDAADFAAASAASMASREGSKAMIDAMLGAVFTGKIDDAKLRTVVETFKDDPKVKAAMAGQSVDASVANLRQGLGDVMKDPALSKDVAEARKAMDDLRAMTGNPPLIPPPKRPWWKFW